MTSDWVIVSNWLGERKGFISEILRSLLQFAAFSFLIWELRLSDESSVKPRFLASQTNLMHIDELIKTPLISSSERTMKMGSFIPEVNILFVKLQDSRQLQANFFEKWYSFVSGVGMHFLYENTTTHFKILKCKVWFPPKSPKKSSPSSARGDEGMIEGVRRVVKSSAESREYVLIYFWGMGTYFYLGDGSIYWLGGWVDIFGGMNTPIPLDLHPWLGIIRWNCWPYKWWKSSKLCR